MVLIDWEKEAQRREGVIVRDVQALLKIKSVYDPSTIRPEAPFGEGIFQALSYMLEKGKEAGFRTKNIDGYAGYIEFGEGKECVGILCHLDVVPAGSGWTYAPFCGTVQDGKIYGRGALDNKGPAVATYYAMKIVRDLGLPLKRRVRLILGCDEEREWRCVDYYFQKEEMPAVGFVPDADFPVIYAEKGICDFIITYRAQKENEISSLFTVQYLHAGERLNVVPDVGEALVYGERKHHEKLSETFQAFLKENGLTGKINIEGESVRFFIYGVAAHGMEPEKGINAGLMLAKFLQTLNVDAAAKTFLTFVNDYLADDTRGRKLGIAAKDQKLGDLTVNCGKISYRRNEKGEIGLNIRYPASVNMENIVFQLQSVVRSPFALKKLTHLPPHFVDENSMLIKTLKTVYERQTGQKAELKAIGGGTYARALKEGVAFGPLFPHRQDVAHEKDEHMYIGDLLKATSIYAEAIYELAK